MQRFPAAPLKQVFPRVPDCRSVGGHRASAPNAIETFEFGRFTLLRRSRRLLADGAPVALGTRAFDILMVLIEADGMPVTKRELLARVWPDVVVEESNLKVQVYALRKALGTDRDFVRTECGRGYSFTAPARANTAARQSGAADDAGELPAASKIGRPADPSAIALQLARIDAKLSRALAMLVTKEELLSRVWPDATRGNRKSAPKRRTAPCL